MSMSKLIYSTNKNYLFINSGVNEMHLVDFN